MKISFLSCWILVLAFTARAQDSFFVQRSGARLILAGIPFYAIGANCYFLPELAALGDTNHVIEVLRTARQLGLTTIRTWGFNDGSDSTNPATIQFGPGRYNERALRGLDYVVAKAQEYSLRLIIPFVNNWDDYGGMNQYVRWLGRGALGKGAQTTTQPMTIQKITGVGGRSYVARLSSSLSHDDFYRDSTIKQWYKNYASTLLNRVNVYTGRAYKDEPAVFLWELANEPRSSDETGETVARWVSEMSQFVKSIDRIHLVGTGEEGHDVRPDFYSTVEFRRQRWLFDGTAGTSFPANLESPEIDVGSIHCYPEDWGLTPTAVVAWILDHQRLARKQNKPLIVGEIGIRRARNPIFDAVFSTSLSESVSGILVWQLAYQGRADNDGFAISCSPDESLCNLLTRFGEIFALKRSSTYRPPVTVKLLPNYPNPFNYVSAISFDVPLQTAIRLEVFNLLGQKISTLVDDVRNPGRHVVLFNASDASSGVYVARLTVGTVILHQKMTLVK